MVIYVISLVLQRQPSTRSRTTYKQEHRQTTRPADSSLCSSDSFVSSPHCGLRGPALKACYDVRSLEKRLLVFRIDRRRSNVRLCDPVRQHGQARNRIDRDKRLQRLSPRRFLVPLCAMLAQRSETTQKEVPYLHTFIQFPDELLVRLVRRRPPAH